MRVMSAGDGFRYLLRTVAAGDGVRSLSTPLTQYYSAKGTPPGRWMGGGVRGLGGAAIGIGDTVTEEQLQLLIGQGRDPISGAALGRAYPEYGVTARSAVVDPGFKTVPRSADRGTDPRPPTEEVPRAARRRAVAGYDFTFSILKSASVLWGISDATTQARILCAHHADDIADAAKH